MENNHIQSYFFPLMNIEPTKKYDEFNDVERFVCSPIINSTESEYFIDPKPHVSQTQISELVKKISDKMVKVLEKQLDTE